MWIADQWKDYEVIDCSKGEKLERWGEYILVRPDPQVIWDTPKNDRGWKHKNGHYHRSKKGGGEWEFISLPEQWQIHYKDLTFNLKPFSFKHTGLVFRKDPKRGTPDKGLKSLCLYRRRYIGRCGRRRQRHPCRRIQRHGKLGQGKCGFFRPVRQADPVAGG